MIDETLKATICKSDKCLHCPRAGLGQSQLALARGQLGPGLIGSGQGCARANPDPPIIKYSTNVQKNMY